MKLLLVLTLATAALATTDFLDYQKEFGKKYANKQEAVNRELIFKQNVDRIMEHNERFARGEETYTMGINEYTDMTLEEAKLYRPGLPKLTDAVKAQWPSDDKELEAMRAKYEKSEKVDEINWVDRGAVSSVKNQGSCGSCSAFAVTAATDACYFKASGTLFDDLSEQYLVDCAYQYDYDGWGAYGCDGAWPQAYFAYIIEQRRGEMQTEQAYPYMAQNGQCHAYTDGFYKAATVKSFRNKWSPTEKDLMVMIQEGPVATTLEAETGLFGYSGGVLDSSSCCNALADVSCSNRNNHAVTVVGYGTLNGLDYWLVKNSWGASWGDRGFFKIKRGTGHCGISSQLINIPEC